MDKEFRELVSRLKSAVPHNLAAVIVHGSAVLSQGNHATTDYQVLIVTKTLAASDLRAMRSTVQWWTFSGYSMPTFFTSKEFIDSLDVFPVEFSQMKRAYRVLYGDDLLSGQESSKGNLRWQTEHELRGKLLRLRSLYLPASLSSRELVPLMTESVVTFVRFMRPILEILGDAPVLERLATVQRVGERLQIDMAPVARVLQLRETPTKLTDDEAHELFEAYQHSLTTLIECVNDI
jgi:hypothetical protein